MHHTYTHTVAGDAVAARVRAFLFFARPMPRLNNDENIRSTSCSFFEKIVHIIRGLYRD